MTLRCEVPNFEMIQYFLMFKKQLSLYLDGNNLSALVGIFLQDEGILSKSAAILNLEYFTKYVPARFFFQLLLAGAWNCKGCTL